MRKTTAILAAFSLMALGSGAAHADDMRMVAPNKPAAAATKPKAGNEHRQGMQHGGQQMHDQMMMDHQMGMQNMQNMQNMQGMQGQGQSGMNMGCGGKGGCKDKMKAMGSDKPADAPMPMDGHM